MKKIIILFLVLVIIEAKSYDDYLKCYEEKKCDDKYLKNPTKEDLADV